MTSDEMMAGKRNHPRGGRNHSTAVDKVTRMGIAGKGLGVGAGKAQRLFLVFRNGPLSVLGILTVLEKSQKE